ncbi:unnamed protein product [Closterium sp. Naga37s-1]|nr:unnamed protein product [Closterium sp. Naga37s-1]
MSSGDGNQAGGAGRGGGGGGGGGPVPSSGFPSAGRPMGMGAPPSTSGYASAPPPPMGMRAMPPPGMPMHHFIFMRPPPGAPMHHFRPPPGASPLPFPFPGMPRAPSPFPHALARPPSLPPPNMRLPAPPHGGGAPLSSFLAAAALRGGAGAGGTGGAGGEKAQTTVYVGKLAPSVDDTLVVKLLELCGPLRSWKRAADPTSGSPKGFGFCEFDTADGVLRALRLLNRREIDGQNLLLNVNAATREYLERVVTSRKASFAALEASRKGVADQGRKAGGEGEADGEKANGKDETSEEADGVKAGEAGGEAKKDEEGKGGSKEEGKDEKDEEGEEKEEEERRKEEEAKVFGLVTPEDKDKDEAALAKLNGMLQERAKLLPPPPPPPLKDASKENDTSAAESSEQGDGHRREGRKREREDADSDDDAGHERAREEEEDARDREKEEREREEAKEREEQQRREAVAFVSEVVGEASVLLGGQAAGAAGAEAAALGGMAGDEGGVGGADGIGAGGLIKSEATNGLADLLPSLHPPSAAPIAAAGSPGGAQAGQVAGSEGAGGSRQGGRGRESEVDALVRAVAAHAKDREGRAAPAPSKKSRTLASVFGAEEDEEELARKKLRPLVPIDYDDGGSDGAAGTAAAAAGGGGHGGSSLAPPAAAAAAGAGGLAASIAAAAEFAKRLSQGGGPGKEEERRRSGGGEAGAGGGEKEKAGPKAVVDVKSLIDSIPKSKDELFAVPINWTVYDESALHQRMRPWVARKIREFLGEEEPTLVDFILSKTQQHVGGAALLGLLEPILDEEAEMFVLKMWRMLIFEIRRVEMGLTGKAGAK